MGIDIAKKHVKRRVRTNPRSDDPYLRLLVKLYKFLARRTGSEFNQVVLHRLNMSNVNRPPVSVSRLTRYMAGKEDKIAVVVADVTNDSRLLKVPKLTVVALRFTETARARIVKAGGECLTFDQLALRAPTGANCVLLRGAKSHRTALKYMGAAGLPGSTVRPRVRSSGRKFERARGRRPSCGYKK
jgi:large subunit ribosomal protein L18e